MTIGRAVIIPFAVPAEARGLGLGLAALFHGFASLEGQSVGLAQLLARPREDAAPQAGGGPDPRKADPGPVEAFVPPDAWRDLTRQGSGFPAPGDLGVVITGAFEPPGEGKGMIQLLAFAPKDGRTMARADVHVDGARAGESLLSAFSDVWGKVGGELGLVSDIGDLGWEALESVLRAERCVLHDPQRNGPHDRLAAMLHLGRAVGDAPLARFPAGRLAAVALETAISPLLDAKLAAAAIRALDRASVDAPAHVDLLEASAALHARLGHAREAEAQATAALDRAPERARLYAILSEARRAQGDLDGALAAVDAGLRKVRDDGLLATERAVVLAQRGDLAGAELGWKRVLSRDSVYPSAFVNLAALAAEKKDLPLAQALVDEALAARHARPEVLRRAIQLAVATEEDGVPRAARVAKLAVSLVERVPADAWGFLVLAQARVRLGEPAAALAAFARVTEIAPTTALAAEAQRERLACADPQASLEIEALLRAAETAPVETLDGVAARGRALARAHAVWTAEFARGVAEKRQHRWAAARVAFESALELAPGATPAHLELVELCLRADAGDAARALTHAERVVVLEGRTPRALACLALALDASGQAAAATEAAKEALAALPGDARLLGIVTGERRTEANATRPSFWERLRVKVLPR
jgi:tetratricopeptide (TPR) repeat protein